MATKSLPGQDTETDSADASSDAGSKPLTLDDLTSHSAPSLENLSSGQAPAPTAPPPAPTAASTAPADSTSTNLDTLIGTNPWEQQQPPTV